MGSICRNGQVLVISAHHTVHRYTGTPHHVLSCESQRTPQWVGHHHPAQKKKHTKKKSIHNFSQLFTTFHIFSQFFTTFHQPSQFCSGFRVVKICENLSHFVKICEMHTPREAPLSQFTLKYITSADTARGLLQQVCSYHHARPVPVQIPWGKKKLEKNRVSLGVFGGLRRVKKNGENKIFIFTG